MRDPARVALDDVSENLGEVLRRADRLLAEWSAFGAKVRDQVDREARAIGLTVANSIEGAVRGAADEAIAREIESRLAALATELARLEQRSRAAARALDDERRHQRRIAWLAIAGIAIANALLVLLLLRDPPAPIVTAPQVNPTTNTEPVQAAPSAAQGAEPIGAPVGAPAIPAVPIDAGVSAIAIDAGAAASGAANDSVPKPPLPKPVVAKPSSTKRTLPRRN